MKVFVSSGIGLSPFLREASKQKDKANLEGKYSIEHVVHHQHQFADLSWRFFTIFHYLCFYTNIEYYAEAIVCVLKSATS